MDLDGEIQLTSESSDWAPWDRGWKLDRDVGARITAHVGGGTYGKRGRVQEMGETDLLGPDTTYIHCTTLNDTEIQMIVGIGGTVSLAAVVWGMDTSNVDSVFVAGRALKRNSELLDVDLDRLTSLVHESRDYVVKKARFKLPEI